MCRWYKVREVVCCGSAALGTVTFAQAYDATSPSSLSL